MYLVLLVRIFSVFLTLETPPKNFIGENFMLVNSQELKDLYYNFIKLESSGIGLDRKSKSSLERKDLNIEYFEKIAEEINTKSYRYIPYKENLILKGRNSFPRVISVPTYRDKIVLKYLSKELLNKYYSGFSLELAQEKIENICKELTNYQYFIKLDLVGFYDNINHHILLNKLEAKKCPKEFLKLIEGSISNPTVYPESSKYEKKLKNIKGVNQGLSTSNILAEIYLEEFDEFMKGKDGIKFFRFVDDILILYNYNDKDVNSISKGKLMIEEIELKLRNDYHLTLNHSKTHYGKLTEGLDYLGYRIIDKNLTIKKNNVLKQEKKLEKLFSEYSYLRHSNSHLLEFQFWRINCSITGIKVTSVENKPEKKEITKRYGWLFYFSKINDYTLMYRLDKLLKKFSKRYNLLPEHQNKLKKFSRSLLEIKKNKNSTYICDINKEFDTPEKRKEFLISKKLYSENVMNIMDDSGINNLFNGIIFKTVRELEEDKGRES